MRITSLRRLAAVFSVPAFLIVAGVAHAQFTAPTCVPPNCNPEVIQDLLITGTAQSASINITGSGKLGGTFQTGANAPVLTAATDNLYYGNVGGTSTNGSLLLLQFGAADRLRVGLTGQIQVPNGTVGAPSYSFIGDTNTGFHSPSADTINVNTNGIIRMQFTNNATFLNTGVLYIPVGTAAAPSLTFQGDPNTGIYHSAADTVNISTAGVNRFQIDSTGLVTIPGSLTVNGTFTASSGFSGDGSGLTNLNASNISSGTLNDARLSSNVALLDRASQTFTGNNTFSGMTSLGSAALVAGAGQNVLYGVADSTSTGNLLLLQSENAGVYTDRFRVAMDGAVTAGSFSGVGTALTALNASNLASGTVPSARISGTYGNALTFSNRTSFGSAALNVTAGNNLLYGNVDAATAGNLLLLQNESVDRFRVDAAGNVTAAGNLTVSGSITAGGSTLCQQNGVNCPSMVSGSGTANYVPKWSGSTALGDSALYDDGGGNIGLGTTSPSAKLSVAGSISASNISTYMVAAGAAGVTGQVVGVGSYGVVGSGGSYGVYGSSGNYGVYGYNTSAGAGGAGVYGFGTGTSPGVQGSSASGWGGSFSSLYVTPGTAYFASAVTLNGGASLGANSLLTLGSAAADPVGANGAMYYSTASNAFRCYVNGAWGGCGVGGSGTTNYVAKFTGSGTVGNSLIRDDGTGVAIGGTPAATAQLVVGPTNQNNALTATTNAANGVGIYGFGMGSSSIGLYGQGQGAGVFGLGGGAGGVGLQGTGQYAGVTGTTANVWGYGVQGSVPAGSYVYGVYGITPSSQYSSAGVAGINTGNGMGGYFQSSNPTTYALSAYNSGNPATGFAIQAQGSSSFVGNVNVTNVLGVAGLLNSSGNNIFGDAAADTMTIWGTTLTVPNGLNIDANTLYVDAAANSVGIGTTSPYEKLHVAGNALFDSGIAIGPNGPWANYGVVSQASESAGHFFNSNYASVYGSLGYAYGGDRYGVYGSAIDSTGSVKYAGYFTAAGSGTNYGIYANGSSYGVYGNGTSYGVYGNGSSYGVYGNGSSYGVRGYGGSYGALFGNPTGSVYLAGSTYGVYTCCSQTYGVYAYGNSTAGRFYDYDGTATTFIAGASWGVEIITGNAYKPSGSTWVNPSDARLKKDIAPFTDGLEVARKLNPKSFTWNGLADSQEGLRDSGFIAQEVKDIVPYMIGTRKAKLHPEDAEETDLYTLDQSELPLILLNSVKELDFRIEGLEAKITQKDAEQDARIQELERKMKELEERIETLEE